MDERRVIAACCASRESYSRARRVLDLADMSQLGQAVFELVAQYYDTDPDANSVDRQLLESFATRQFPKHTEKFKAYIDQLPGDISSANVLKDLYEFKLRALQMRISEECATGNSAADELIEEYQELKAAGTVDVYEESKVIVPSNVEAAMELFSPDNMVPLYPKSLNEALGGGMPMGSHGLIFAPPEVGKTMFAVNLACGAAHEGRRVLYVGNEDPYQMILMRMYSRMTGMTRNEIMQDPATANKLADQHNIKNITLASLAPGSFSDIMSLHKRFKRPELIILDQLTNIAAPNGTHVEQFDWLAKRARKLGKVTGSVVISLCQGADTAIGKRNLEMGDVYFSNIAVQAQVDAMIGVGMDHEDQQVGRRMMCLVKNKISGGHDNVPVMVDDALSKVRSI